MTSLSAHFQHYGTPRTEPSVQDRVRRQHGMKGRRSQSSYARAAQQSVQQRAMHADIYWRQQAGNRWNNSSPVPSNTLPPRGAAVPPNAMAGFDPPPMLHPMHDYPVDIRPPISPTITITDAQMRAAFGPSPIFGTSDVGYATPATMPANPASPIQETYGELVEDDLESMKALSLSEMVAVMHGAEIPKSNTSSPNRHAPFSCTPTPILGMRSHPTLSAEAMQFRLPPSTAEAPMPPGYDWDSSSTC